MVFGLLGSTYLLGSRAISMGRERCRSVMIRHDWCVLLSPKTVAMGWEDE